MAFVTVLAAPGLHAGEAPSRADENIALTPVSQDRSFVDRLPTRARELRKFAQRPDAWFLHHLAGPRITVDGQVLDAKLQFKLETEAKNRAASRQMGQRQLLDAWSTRSGREKLREAVIVNWTRYAYDIGKVAAIEDAAIPGPAGTLPVRIYRPAGSGEKPAIVYFHGGGFLMADYKAVEPQAKILAREAGAVVLSVNYRLAPEHPFPAAQEDAVAAYRWIVAHARALGIRADAIGVAGDSAGGNLALVVTQAQINLGKAIPKAVLLYYPFVDIHFDRYDSYRLFGQGFGLDKWFLDVATRQFLSKPSDKSHPWLNLDRTLDFRKFPPTIVAIAGFDPLRDQDRVLADKLKAAGVPVVRRQYPGLTHGFLEMSGVIDAAFKASFDTAIAMGHLLHE